MAKMKAYSVPHPEPGAESGDGRVGDRGKASGRKPLSEVRRSAEGFRTERSYGSELLPRRSSPTSPALILTMQAASIPCSDLQIISAGLLSSRSMLEERRVFQHSYLNLLVSHFRDLSPSGKVRCGAAQVPSSLCSPSLRSNRSDYASWSLRVLVPFAQEVSEYYE